MRTIRLDQRALFTLALSVVILTGCARSPSSKFYQLNPVQTKTSITRDVSPDQSQVIAIGPVRIPDYLDQRQIVTRSGKNELRFSEFDRWAGSLEGDVVRVLVENISDLLPADQFSVTRWSPYSENRAPSAYRVEVRVDRFEGTLGGSVSLRAQWGLYTKDNGLLQKRESIINEHANDSSYGALVGAMSSALERMSRDIADGIRSTVPESK
jgi:hypothetical protein